MPLRLNTHIAPAISDGNKSHARVEQWPAAALRRWDARLLQQRLQCTTGAAGARTQPLATAAPAHNELRRQVRKIDRAMDVALERKLAEAARQLQQAVHDARVAFDCIGLDEVDRAHTHTLLARAAVDAAENALRVTLGGGRDEADI